MSKNPVAAFFDTLAQFYRKAYLRLYRRDDPSADLRAARIAEVADLLADGSKNGHDRDRTAGHQDGLGGIDQRAAPADYERPAATPVRRVAEHISSR